MRKLINSPDEFVDEVLAAILLAHPDQLRGDSPEGRVGIVTGGGSGHLPVFLGYVGAGLCSGVAVGNVFSSPSPEEILAATKAVSGGKGVLYLFGNYGGDVLNFELAADLAELEEIKTETVLINDDVMSASPERSETRRGVAGMVMAYKCAGAAAERGDDLDEVARIATKAVAATRSAGVGLSPTILPSAGKPTFELAEGEMEIGIGIHGEPGIHRGHLETADQVTDRLLAPILDDLDPEPGSKVVLMVNGMGATPLEELYLLYGRAHRTLADRQVRVARPYVGEFATSLEMAGASITVMVLDAELAGLIDAPASSPFFRQ